MGLLLTKRRHLKFITQQKESLFSPRIPVGFQPNFFMEENHIVSRFPGCSQRNHIRHLIHSRKFLLGKLISSSGRVSFFSQDFHTYKKMIPSREWNKTSLPFPRGLNRGPRTSPLVLISAEDFVLGSFNCNSKDRRTRRISPSIILDREFGWKIRSSQKMGIRGETGKEVRGTLINGVGD